MSKVKTKAKISAKEYVWYIIACVFAAWGIAEIICGLIIEFSNTLVSNMPLYQAQTKYIELFGLSFMNWGLILMAIGVVIGVVTLCVFANRYDRESEKATRRAARLSHNNPVGEAPVVDAEVK